MGKNLLGYELQETIGKMRFEFTPSEEARRVAAEFRLIIEGSRLF